MVAKKSSLQCYIEALPSIMLLLSSWTSCQMLPTYIPKLRMKIRMHHSLLETLMDIPSFGDLMVTQRLKVGKLKNLLSSLGLSQLISEPTNFEPNKKPSCVDLVITDQPNLVLDSGTRASLDSFCHHQITYCKLISTYLLPHLSKEEFGIITGQTILCSKGACIGFLGSST